MPDSEQVVDLGAVLDRIDGDQELLRELVLLYLEDERQLLAQLDQAIASQDATAVGRSAHTLKGAVSNFCAARAQAAALALEIAGREGRIGDCPALLEALRAQLLPVRQALSALAG